MASRRSGYAVSLLILVSLGLSSTACQNACEALADTICECSPNQAEQNACLEATKSAANVRDTTTEDLAACESKLDTCSCAALEQNDLRACGLSK